VTGRDQEESGKVLLHPENDAYEDIVLRSDQDILICGVVVGVSRRL
jgi:SOS-response transcriptional repressor LexA